ncbi:uncharacterized protein LOC111114503 isoform X3 [Crassostrea virginica]
MWRVMESFVKPESRNIVGRRKRKLEHEEQGESSSMAGSSSTDEECEMTCEQSKEDSTKRKSFLRSSLSKEWISTSTSEEDNEDTEGNSPARKWQYVDLENINICYCEEPQPLEEFMQIVKEDVLEKFPDTPDFVETVGKFTKLTKENLLVSVDLDYFRQKREQPTDYKYYIEKRFFEDIKSDIEKAKEADRDLEHTNLEVDKRSFVMGDKIVNSTPELAYCTSARKLAVGDNLEGRKILLFVFKVKVKQIKNASSNCLEEQVDSGVLRHVGSELFAGTFFSFLCPNSLGIMRMETKLIFVYLKMPEEHIISIMDCKQPLKTEGKIHYTKPFDMLKAEDRAEVCDFLYWLGCVQNHGRWSLMNTEGN